MSVLTLSAIRAILKSYMYVNGLSAAQIVEELKGEHDVFVSHQAVNHFLLLYKEHIVWQESQDQEGLQKSLIL